MGLIELQVYEALAARKLALVVAKVGSEYENLHSRVSAPWMWASVYDQMQFVLTQHRVSAPEERAGGDLMKRLVALGSSRKPETQRA